jgi:hypothetical protein
MAARQGRNGYVSPLTVPTDRVWTAKDDARYISPLLALPGYKHTPGMSRSWHFITDYGFILTGIIYGIMLFVSGQWPRLVPTSWEVIPDAWQTFVHYATFHWPIEPTATMRTTRSSNSGTLPSSSLWRRSRS